MQVLVFGGSAWVWEEGIRCALDLRGVGVVGVGGGGVVIIEAGICARGGREGEGWRYDEGEESCCCEEEEVVVGDGVLEWISHDEI